jgi:hypothetical protein
MAYTQTDIDNLERAIAMGELKVKFADREVTYRSLDDLKAALRFIEGRIAAQSVPATGPRHQVADFSESNT